MQMDDETSSSFRSFSPSSSSSSSSSSPLASSSQDTTPEQSPNCASFPPDVPVIDPLPHSSINAPSYDPRSQQFACLSQDENTFLSKILDSRQKDRSIIQELQTRRDQLETQLNEERARTDESERQRDAAFAESVRLKQETEVIRTNLTRERTEKAEVERRLDDRNRQLEEELDRLRLQVSDQKKSLKVVVDLYHEAEEKNKTVEDIKKQLAESEQISEERLADLEALRGRFNEEHTQRTAFEVQLSRHGNELARLRTELKEEKQKTADLQRKVEIAGRETAAMETLRSENDSLQRRNEKLRIDIEKQNKVTAQQKAEADKALGTEHKKQMASQSTISRMEQERDELQNQFYQLQGDYKRLEDENATLRLARDASERRCAELSTNVSELKSALDQMTIWEAKRPACLEMTRYRGAPAKISMVQRGPVKVGPNYDLLRV